MPPNEPIPSSVKFFKKSTCISKTLGLYYRLLYYGSLGLKMENYPLKALKTLGFLEKWGFKKAMLKILQDVASLEKFSTPSRFILLDYNKKREVKRQWRKTEYVRSRPEKACV